MTRNHRKKNLCELGLGEDMILQTCTIKKNCKIKLYENKHLSFERPYYHIDTHINLLILIAFLVGMTNFFPVKDKLKFVGKNTKTKMSSFFILRSDD